MKTTDLSYGDALKAAFKGKRVARKSIDFDGYITRFKGDKNFKRVLKLNEEYHIKYEATKADYWAEDWYIFDTDK